MIYAVMSEVRNSDTDDSNEHYRSVRFYTIKDNAIAYARKLAKKEGGLPERFIFSLMSKTATPEPAEIELISVS